MPASAVPSPVEINGERMNDKDLTDDILALAPPATSECPYIVVHEHESTR